MTAFLMLYLITISIELVLSLVMALFLFLIVAPAGAARQSPAEPLAGQERRSPARTVDGALADAFAAVAQGRDDLHAITHARAMLARYARDRAAS